MSGCTALAVIRPFLLLLQPLCNIGQLLLLNQLLV